MRMLTRDKKAALPFGKADVAQHQTGMVVAGMVRIPLICCSIDGGIRFQIVNGDPQSGQTGIQNTMDHLFGQQCLSQK